MPTGIGLMGLGRIGRSIFRILYKNDDLIGHLEFEPGSNTTSDGGQFGTFVPLTPPDDIQFDHGDRFKVFAPELDPPTPDDTAAGLSVTIAARTGTIS